MLPFALFKGGNFAAANAETFVTYAAIYGFLVFSTLYFQTLGFSPFESGLISTPSSIILVLFATRFGTLADKHGPRLYLTLGPALIGAGALLSMGMTEQSDLWTFGVASLRGLLLRTRGAGRADHVDGAQVGPDRVRRDRLRGQLDAFAAREPHVGRPDRARHLPRLRRRLPTLTPSRSRSTRPARRSRARSTPTAPGCSSPAALALAGALIGAFAISNREALGGAGRQLPPFRRSKPKAERLGPLAAASTACSRGRRRAVDDREAIALDVVRALLGEKRARPDEHLEIVLGVGNRLDERVLEDPHDVADRDALGRARIPPRIVSASELEQRVVGRAPVRREHERRELRGDARVHLDDPGRPLRRDEELDVEECVVEPVRPCEPRRRAPRARLARLRRARSGTRSARS